MSSVDRSAAARRAAIPNLLTVARLFLAAGCFLALTLYRFPEGPRWLLPAAAGVFIIAALTDALDGHLARKWSAISVFGRIMDPVADKVLVLGAFILLAGPGFATPGGEAVTGMAPWMVVVILARELLVTSLRSVLEAGGVSFGASGVGKAKMIAQSVAVPAILLICWAAPAEKLLDGWARITLDVIAWLTVLITAASGAPYITRAAAALRTQSGT